MMLNLLPVEYWDFGLRDVFSGLRGGVISRRAGTGQEVVLPSIGRALAVRSGRAGLMLALKALGLPRGAVVGVPLYCCPVVFKAVRAVGYTVRYIDVDPETYCLSTADLSAKSKDLSAVIAVHMFGNTCDVSEVRQTASGVLLIEDCAQSLGSKLNGKLTGTLGDVGVFSFRSGKYVSAGEGGALFAADANMVSRLSRLLAQLPQSRRGEEAVHVAATYVRSQLRQPPLWGICGARLWETYNQRRPEAARAPIVVSRVYESDRMTIARRLPSVDCWVHRQRANAQYYLRHLALPADMFCHEPPRAFFNRLQFPVLLPSEDACEHMVRSLRADSISTSRPYKDIAAIAAEIYGYAGDCPHAERIARTVMVIPCHHALSSAQVEKVAASVNRAWSQIEGRAS